MSFFVRKFRPHKRAHQILGQRYANDTGTQHKNINIVVLDALMRGIGVVAHSRPNAGKFVGSDAGADTAAADEDAAFGSAIEHGAAHGFGEIGIIRRVSLKAPTSRTSLPIERSKSPMAFLS